MNFLPTNYLAPKSVSGYMKIEDGENRIRILSPAITGWEDWDNRKPIRYVLDDKPEYSIDPKKPIKHFWAFIVWNYKLEAIQILQITQASIRKRLEALNTDSEWGAPYGYDIKIFRTGEKVDTEYTVNPVPHKLVSPHIEEAFQEKPIFLEALFDGEDPFAPVERRTQGFFDSDIPHPIVPLKAKKKPQPVAPKEELQALDGEIDIDTFLDFLPDELHGKQEQVTEFVQMCANASKKSVGAYMEQALEEQDRFVDCFKRWLDKTSQARKATA